MRGLNGLPLSDDVIERILMLSPSFSSLLSTILASKSFYEVYRTHPKSILRAVMYNITGPALPQALRLVRYRVPDSGSSSSNSDSETEDEDEEAGDEQEQVLAYETDETDETAPITLTEAREIVKNAEIVDGLEDLWSFRYKDRTSRQSKLTPMESWHFRRAMYRIMLYNRVFSVDKYADAYDSDTQSFGDYDQRLEKIKRTKYLSQFFTDELLQIHSVGVYLMEILEFADSEHEAHDECMTRHLAFCSGPRYVLECYDQVSLGLVLNIVETYEDEWGNTNGLEMFKGYLTYPISKVLEERKMKQPPEDFTHWHSISSEVNGKNDECDRCHESAGFRLLCRLNWVERSTKTGYLADLFSFKGLLSVNCVERTYWDMQIRALYEQRQEQDISTNWASTIMNDIFDDQLLRPEFEDWTKDDYLCDKCLKKFLEEHLWVWLLEHKKKSGVQIAENCRDGYNCYEQYNFLHIQRLNHLCKPTQSDR